MGNEVNFEQVKQNGYTNYLQYRGANRRSGISYDYMDKLNQFVDQGIFVDEKGDGFTNAEKKALEQELFKIHQEHGYSTNFTSMMAGTKTEYNYNDFIRLAKAAGYVLKEQPKQDEVVEEQNQEVVNSTEEKKEEVANPELVNTADNKSDDENKAISDDTIYEVTWQKTTVRDSDGKIIDQNGTYTVNPFVQSTETAETVVANTEKAAEVAEGTVVTNTEKPAEVVAEPVVTNTEKPAEVAADSTDNNELTAEEQINASIDKDPELAGKTPEEQYAILRDRSFDLARKKQELENTTTTTYVKRGLFGIRRTKTREMTAEELEARNAEIAKLEAQIDETSRNKVYVDQVKNRDFWVGKYAQQYLMDENGEIIKKYPQYTREKIQNDNGEELRVARVDNYDASTLKTESKYYTLDVQKVGDPNNANGIYNSIVPDLNNEVEVKTK